MLYVRNEAGEIIATVELRGAIALAPTEVSDLLSMLKTSALKDNALVCIGTLSPVRAAATMHGALDEVIATQESITHTQVARLGLADSARRSAALLGRPLSQIADLPGVENEY